VETAKGEWVKVEFLIDTGADRTVFSNAILEQLGLTQLLPTEEIGGLGGIIGSVTVETRVHLRRETGDEVAFRGQFAAVTNATALDFSVLGRDILDLFAVIIDRPGDTVSLISQRHRYTVIQD